VDRGKYVVQSLIQIETLNIPKILDEGGGEIREV